MDDTLKIRRLLMDSIFEVFEKMFYLFLEPLDGEAGEYRYEASINFHGPYKGELAALFSRPLAQAMVENMLSIEETEIREELLEDCLKESVNMICGNFLRKFDASKVFDLSMPVFISCGPETGRSAASFAGPVLTLNFAGGQGEMRIVMTAPDILGSAGKG